MFDIKKVEFEVSNVKMELQTGLMAKQANASVLATAGETVVLIALVREDEPSSIGDFFPLTVNYREKSYAAGKIPGGFFKREGRPGTSATLTSRLIDRPIRPLFPESFKNEVQITATTLSVDGINSPDILALIGSSAALTISDVPFLGPVGAVRMGYVNNNFVVNLPETQFEESLINLVVAGTKDAVTMVEASGKEVPEEFLLEAIKIGHSHIIKIIDAQLELQKLAGKKKITIEPHELPQKVKQELFSRFTPVLENILYNSKGKVERNKAKKVVVQEFQKELEEKFPDSPETVSLYLKTLHEIEKKIIRDNILLHGKRIDGRKLDEIRPINIMIDLLPRCHGSALFTRGETQALAILTLGTAHDEQVVDDLTFEESKRFMLHYNFPSWSVGELGMPRGPGRREIGHGMLAERALQNTLPEEEVFPYTIRLVSEILESNGSSSMASVCAGSLALMAGGVPIKADISGIAMGLIKEGKKVAILSDILGEEDHMGDMDFKVAGSEKGVTALQMDNKIGGISYEILQKAMEQAKAGRLYILNKMREIIKEPRKDISSYAPRVLSTEIPVEKIGMVIGPGGKTIRKIISETETEIDIEDNGRCYIYSKNKDLAEKALKMIQELTQEAEIGKIYTGRVVRVTDFGAFVEIFPGQDGLVHISELDHQRVRKVEDIVKVGDMITVKVIDIDPMGRVKLSRKETLTKPLHTNYPNKSKNYNNRNHRNRDRRR